MTGPLLAAALTYAELGWPVLPLHSWTGTACTCGRADCTSPAKHPRTRNGLKDATVDARTIGSWWGRWPAANVGLLTGVAFDALDIDGTEGLDTIAAIENQHGQTPEGPTSFTGGGGVHRLYAPTGVGNRSGMLVKVDWRGAGGYIVAPPSGHASGLSYVWADEEGPDTPLQVVTGWLHALLFPPQRPRPATTTSRTRDVANYAKRAFDSEIGELIRAVEGTRNHTLNAAAFNLYQLAAGGELDDQEVTSALTSAALGIGLTDSEIAGTLRSARAAGFASPRTAPALGVIHGNTVVASTQPLRNVASEPGLDEIPPTGWERLDLTAILAGAPPDELPTLFARSDGQPLLYAGKIHSFNGEPESGKSWCALAAAHDTVGGGLTVTYLDFEDNPASVVGRLLGLGATPVDILARFHYHRIDQPFSLDAAIVLDEALAVAAPSLVVLDGITEAMNLCGLDPYGNTDVAKFWAALPRRLQRAGPGPGAAVVLIDHVTKSKEDRGRWAIGAQHKMAAIDGAAFGFEASMPFGRNRHGQARVTVRKDRPGQLRQHAAGEVIGMFHLASEADRVSAWLQEPGPLAADGKFRPTTLMEHVSRYVELHAGSSKNDVESDVRGDNNGVRRAVEVLVAEAYLELIVTNKKHILTSVKPFRNYEEEAPDDRPR